MRPWAWHPWALSSDSWRAPACRMSAARHVALPVWRVRSSLWESRRSHTRGSWEPEPCTAVRAAGGYTPEELFPNCARPGASDGQRGSGGCGEQLWCSRPPRSRAGNPLSSVSIGFIQFWCNML